MEEFKQKPDESEEDYLKRLYGIGDTAVNNLKSTFAEMQEAGVIGICNKCGSNMYANTTHVCVG